MVSGHGLTDLDKSSEAPSSNRNLSGGHKKRPSKGKVNKFMKGVQSMRRAGGKVSKQIGIGYSKETRLALVKSKQEKEMAKHTNKGDKT